MEFLNALQGFREVLGNEIVTVLAVLFSIVMVVIVRSLYLALQDAKAAKSSAEDGEDQWYQEAEEKEEENDRLRAERARLREQLADARMRQADLRDGIVVPTGANVPVVGQQTLDV